MPRKYEKVQELLPVAKKLTNEEFTQQEIADELGLANHKVVWNLLYHEQRKRGRKPAKALQEYKYENKRL